MKNVQQQFAQFAEFWKSVSSGMDPSLSWPLEERMVVRASGIFFNIEW
jgi:hypothetical protein